MSPVFTVIVVILAILAIVDLIVGVSNDAINFLNSSLGSKIASYKTIISVAGHLGRCPHLSRNDGGGT